MSFVIFYRIIKVSQDSDCRRVCSIYIYFQIFRITVNLNIQRTKNGTQIQQGKTDRKRQDSQRTLFRFKASPVTSPSVPCPLPSLYQNIKGKLFQKTVTMEGNVFKMPQRANIRNLSGVTKSALGYVFRAKCFQDCSQSIRNFGSMEVPTLKVY